MGVSTFAQATQLAHAKQNYKYNKGYIYPYSKCWRI